jgi:hypothetical protein
MRSSDAVLFTDSVGRGEDTQREQTCVRVYNELAYVYFEDEPDGFNTLAMSRTRLSVAV